MKDEYISRQAAIDATWKDPSYSDPLNVLTEVRDGIKALPSAQPEIIRCEECIHNGSFDTDCPIRWNGKEYCSFAEMGQYHK